MKPARFSDFYSKYGPLLLLCALALISTALSRDFLKPHNLMNIIHQQSFTGIVALGMTFVITAGGIDLSVGSLAALVGAVVLLVLEYFNGSAFGMVAAILVGLFAGTLGGMINGGLVTRGKIAPFIVTLGTMSIFRSLVRHICEGGQVICAGSLYQPILSSRFIGIPLPVWVFISMAIFFQLVLTQTRYGRYICAVGADAETARFSAIRVDLVRFTSYAMGGLAVGVAAILTAARLTAINSTDTGNNFELDAIAAVVIGGTSMSGGRGTVLGTVAGAIILGIINNMLNQVNMAEMSLSPYLSGAIKGIVIIGAVLLQYRRKT